MKKALASLAFSCVLLLAYCNFTDEGAENAVTQKAEETQADKEVIDKKDNAEKEVKSNSDEESAYDNFYADKITAEDIVYNWRSDGLSAEPLRDNTSKQCGIGKMDCSQLVTTDDVSVFIWPSNEEAIKVGSEHHDFTIENITIRFNEPLDPKEKYITSLEKFINEKAKILNN